MNITEKCIESYSRHKNLKLTGIDIGIPWQTVYTHLKKAGVAVTGDKGRYGSATDRIAILGEGFFKKAVPDAIDNNESEYQSTIDFTVNGYSVDVKTSRLHDKRPNSKGGKDPERWSFCINKQKDKADFFVLYALSKENKPQHVFLVPNETATSRSIISIPMTLSSKWADFMIEESDLHPFFMNL
jgi:hypothetical protein